MTSGSNKYEQVREEYVRLLDEYAKALTHDANNLSELFDRASDAWLRLRAVAPLDSTEASVSEDMHLVGAFSHAVGAGHVGEAERLYYAMSGENRKNADMTDSENPGSIKIWVRR